MSLFETRELRKCDKKGRLHNIYNDDSMTRKYSNDVTMTMKNSNDVTMTKKNSNDVTMTIKNSNDVTRTPATTMTKKKAITKTNA